MSDPQLNSLPFEEKKQQAFLGHVFTPNDGKVFLQIKDQVRPEWFVNGHAAKLYKGYLEFFKKANRVPMSHQEFLGMDEFRAEDMATKQKLAAYYALCQNEKLSWGWDLISKDLATWLKVRIYHEGVTKSAHDFNHKKLDSAIATLSESVKRFQDVCFDGATPSDFSNPRGLVESMQVETSDALTTGLDIFDNVLNPDCTKGSLLKGDTTVLLAPTNIGKCLGQGTEIIDFSGKIVLVENVKPGDLLMGPDGKPRKVLSTTKGRAPMFRIDPKVGGRSWTCNAPHVLSLKSSWGSDQGAIVNIPLQEYEKKSKDWKRRMKMYRANLDFGQKNLPVDPYILGMWLGDGHSNRASLTTMDSELATVWKEWVISNGDGCAKYDKEGNRASIYAATNVGNVAASSQSLRDLGVSDDKHIPHDYLTSSREQRLQLLAGLIDTDGYYGSDIGFFEITQKNFRLAKNIAYLARSLGFKVSEKEVTKADQNGTKGQYQRLNIMGKLSEIPTKLARKQAKDGKKAADTTGFTVTPVGEDDYYGFTLDGDHLFVLGDFTVTHNTTAMITFARHNVMLGKSVLVVALEGREGDLMEKIWTSTLSVTKKEFRRMALSTDPKDSMYMAAGVNRLQKYLHHIWYVKAEMYVEDVISMIRQKNDQRIALTGAGYDLVIVDYPALLGSRNFHGQKGEKRFLDDYVYRAFVNLGGELRYHSILAVQGNRESSKVNKGNGKDDNRLLTKEDIAESWGPTNSATNIITINRSPLDMVNHRLTYYIDKSRSNETGWAVVCRSNYGHGLTHSNDLGGVCYRGTDTMIEKIERLMSEHRNQIVTTEKLR